MLNILSLLLAVSQRCTSCLNPPNLENYSFILADEVTSENRYVGLTYHIRISNSHAGRERESHFSITCAIENVICLN